MTPTHLRRTLRSHGPVRMRARLPLSAAFPVILCLLGLLPFSAAGGVLHEDLVKALNRSAPDETVSGLIMLGQQLDLPILEREMAAQGIHSRWRRHEFVLRAAQALAQRTQQPLIEELKGLISRSEIISYEPFWIANMIAVRSKPSGFLRLSLRGDVGIIYPDQEVSLRFDWREQASRNPEPFRMPTEIIRDGASLSPALTAINVQPAWDLGYTGAGRLVCTFDSGADGNHPALASGWRGIQPGITWDQGWHDPYGSTQFPYDSAFHGTHVLGIIAAQPSGGEAIGVAPDVQWMAAGVLIGWNVSKIVECYQWAADPDGNPSTIADVPDVINNSWGTSDDCSSVFWGAIDLVEAAGIVNTISVDNSGPDPASVNSPESRASSPYVNFSVGNVDPHTPGYPISSSSGRGPSPCDGVSIKPNVVAPGTDIRSSIPGGGYGSMSGTSQACPFVSGAVAILRQLNPALTVEQVKQVLAGTATDLGPSGPDNAYGWGLINLGAAVDYVIAHLPPSPTPRSLSGIALPDSGISLHWLAPAGIVATNGLTGYKIYRAPDQQAYPGTPLVSIDPTTTECFDPILVYGVYRYVVTAGYEDGTESEPSNEIIMEVRDPAGTPEGASFGGRAGLAVCPNPFRAWTELRWRSPHTDQPAAAIEIFDASGRRVRRIASAGRAGISRILWDGHDDAGAALPAGIYFARTTGETGRALQRMVLIR